MNSQYESIISNGQQQSQKVLSQTDKEQLDNQLKRRVKKVKSDYIGEHGDDVEAKELSQETLHTRALLAEIKYLKVLDDDDLKLQFVTYNEYLIIVTESEGLFIRMDLYDTVQKSLNEHKVLFESQYGEYYLNAIHYAALKGKIMLVKLLLKHGAEINLQDNKKYTALHYAVKNGDTEVVKLLLEHGAKINARCFEGKNPLDLLFMTTQVKNQLKNLLLDYVKKLSPEEQTECLKNVGSKSSLNETTGLSDLTYCIKYIQEQSDKITDEKHTTSLDDNIQDIDERLKEIQFYKYIETFHEYYENFLKQGNNYANAAVAVKKLIDTCNEAKVTLFQSIPDCDENLEIFKNTCKQAVETARPVLRTHRHLHKLIAKFAAIIITFPISLSLYALGFFSFKTKTEKLLDSFDEGLALDPFSEGQDLVSCKEAQPLTPLKKGTDLDSSNEDSNQSALSNNQGAF